jgi:hypothetical protein
LAGDGAHGANAVYHVAGRGQATRAEFARATFEESCFRFEAAFDYRCPDWRKSLPPVVERLIAGR